VYKTILTLLATVALAVSAIPAPADEVTDAALAESDTLLAKGDLKGCLAVLDKAIETVTTDKKVRLDREVGPLYLARGLTREKALKWAEALADFRKAIELLPDDPDPYYHAAMIAATSADAKLRNGKLAVMYGEKAAGLAEKRYGAAAKAAFDSFQLVEAADLLIKYMQVRESLGAAYAEDGQFKKAVEHQLKSIDAAKVWVSVFNSDALLKQRQRITELLEGAEEQLKLYRESKPLRSR